MGQLNQIGAKAFALHKLHVGGNINAGRIMPCKLKTYEIHGGELRPVFQLSNGQELSVEIYSIFYTLEEAAEALCPTKKKKESHGRNRRKTPGE